MEDSGRTCTYSFGDDGLTATASPSGRLLRISRHFPGEKFGYCVDHWDISEPYMAIERITDFVSAANDPDHNIGFYPDQESWLFAAESASVGFTNDRWPVFYINGEDGRCEIQYSISHGAIYQTFNFSDSRPPMAFLSDLLLCQLDFIGDSNQFNEADYDDDGYETHLLNEGKCIKRSHKLGPDDNRHAALFVYAFSDNTALTFERFTKHKDAASEDDSTIGEQGVGQEGDAVEGIYGEIYGHSDAVRDDSGNDDEENTYYRISDDNGVSQPTKVTLIYVLSLESGELESPPEPLKFTAAPEFPKMDASKRIFTPTNPDLNFALRRNLEYILSVCSIPVYPDAKDDQEFAVALTCGDIDSHRIVTAASFHCFQFLLMSLKHFVSRLGHNEHEYPEAVNCDECSLIKRIRKVLKGHLKWVFGEQYRNLARNPSCPHSWVNGEEIKGWEDDFYLSSESLVDAPFQFIKAGDYKEYDSGWEVPRAAKPAVRTWVKKLDEKNKLGCYAFPRNMEEQTHNFFLTDHVMIWRTAKCVELLGLKSELSVDIAQEEGDKIQPKRKPRKREYLAIKIQNQILKRFTADNPASKKRMLSVSRSPGHIQFLLRTRDTLLFHAMDSQFFDKPGAKLTHTGNEWQNKIDIWKSLINCQPLHEDNEDDSWDEPIRFALSIVMAFKGKSMNSRSPREMHKRGMDVLLQSKWPNGLFPGQLDIDGEPAIYDEEMKLDEYWSNSFEIPCLLWKYGEYPINRKSTLLSPGAELELDYELSGPQKALVEYQKSAKSLEHSNSVSMKSTFPRNNVLDQTNIVELSDEWLYNVPVFFNGYGGSVHDGCWQLDKDTSSAHRPQVYLEGATIDIPRSKTGNKTLSSLEEMTNHLSPGGLKTLMLETRLPWKAKKRLCMLFAADPQANVPYPQTRSETDVMFNFYERHKSCSKHFSEDTAAEMNTWATELHLSFNALEISEESSPAEHATSEEKGLDGLVSRVRAFGCKRLKQVIMSFRFDGDFWDRYWTCYFLFCDPQFVDGETLDEVKGKYNDTLQKILYNEGEAGRRRLDINKHHWRQRRVLELLLFQAMVDFMYRCTVRITDDSKSIAKEDDIFLTDSDTGSDGKSYDSSRQEINICQRCLREHQQRLQTVEQDMVENFAQIDLWLKRERERQAERPRWTFNDEMKYRSTIMKLLNQNDHTIQDLRRSHSNLRNLIEKINRMLQELERRLERLDKELEKQDRVREANRNADIRRFTYVTVIFLPLGFATGVFSMSGAPSGTTLGNMILTAISAFAITALLIICVTNLDVIRKYYRKTRKLQKDEMLAAFREAKKGWGGYKPAKKPSDDNESEMDLGLFDLFEGQEMGVKEQGRIDEQWERIKGWWRKIKKPGDKNEGLQHTEDEIELVKVGTRSEGGSMRNGRESRNSERRSWHSEGSVYLQMEPVRSSDNIV